MKSGANFQDRNKIKEMSSGDLTPEEISDELQISLSCIESFVVKNEDDDEDGDKEILE